MTTYALLFEARSIQRWIFAGGRLKDMVSASELVAELTCAPLDAALASLGLAGEGAGVRFARRAAGAFYVFFDQRDAAEKLRDIWSLFVPRWAPYLEMLLILAEGENDAEALNKGLAQLGMARNFQPVDLPEAGPFAERAPRTGLPACGISHGEFVDAGLARKRQFSISPGDGSERRFAGEETGLKQALVFPRNLSPADVSEDEPWGLDFPFEGEDRRLAVIHADGNGLGQVLHALSGLAGNYPEATARLYLGFSQALERATESAAQGAYRETLKPAAVGENPARIPARPLILGGDDLTLIIRADLALAFAASFTRHFEEASRRELSAWRMSESLAQFCAALPTALTLCTGIAYISANQPFSMAAHLAETLCQHAKQTGQAVLEKGIGGSANRPKPSALAFHRVTTSLVDDDQLDAPVRLGERDIRLSMGVWGIRAEDGLPTLSTLLEFASKLGGQGMPRGPLRRLLTGLQQNPEAAREMWRRRKELFPDVVLAMDALLAALGEPDKDLPLVRAHHDGQWRTPLGDALDLIAVDGIKPMALRETK